MQPVHLIGRFYRENREIFLLLLSGALLAVTAMQFVFPLTGVPVEEPNASGQGTMIQKGFPWRSEI
jgi:hypothetical protein